MFSDGGVMQEAMAHMISLLRKEFSEQLGQLRAEMNIQTGIARGQIAEIKRDVA